MKTQEALKQWGIALTGGIACGKSTIASIIRQQGYIVLDADAMSRAVVEPGTEGLADVVQAFGPSILNSDGTMNRQRMREVVFQDPGRRQALEAIIHPRLEAEVQKALEIKGFVQHPRLWFYEASLIYERQRAADFKAVWVAYCPVELQITRVMQRDGCSQDMAEAILLAQMPARDKADRADYVIHTDCPYPELEQRVLKALLDLKPVS
ncbi:MAG TPA: dephospho-CoA kinase [Oligoflexus sp.]|uniref:dephospho-CoA kinase n=1 Tax=Oligoflexus sp. TaxID=1971216 RepID=UPI002D739058|nr:dephospho-CoA kinase [Oligoflexus sp.]HYX33082.1 dephospho-CoA kinase [Oligoflexus sp.]